MQLRFDLIFYNKINFNLLDPSYFYHPVRTKEADIAINDHFFLSNHKNAVIFSKIIDNLSKYSIRPVCAAKQFLDTNSINYKNLFEIGKDFDLLRHFLTRPPKKKVIP